MLHSGKRRHGALDIKSGERASLIMWTKSAAFRRTDTYKRRWGRLADIQAERGVPDRVCLSYTHDRDYGEYKKYPPGKAHFSGRAWCPPSHACYDTMEPIDTLGWRKKQSSPRDL